MNRRRFITSLATGAAVAAAPKLVGSDDLTIKLPYSPAPKRPEVDFNVLLWAIAERETGNDDTRVGASGERSKYQISRTVWRQHNTKVHGRFDRDCRGNAANWLAFRHLRWLDANIPRQTHLESTQREFCLAFAWNAGLTAWVRPSGHRNISLPLTYAGHVQNLYQSRLRSLSV